MRIHEYTRQTDRWLTSMPGLATRFRKPVSVAIAVTAATRNVRRQFGITVENADGSRLGSGVEGGRWAARRRRLAAEDGCRCRRQGKVNGGWWCQCGHLRHAGERCVALIGMSADFAERFSRVMNAVEPVNEAERLADQHQCQRKQQQAAPTMAQPVECEMR